MPSASRAMTSTKGTTQATIWGEAQPKGGREEREGGRGEERGGGRGRGEEGGGGRGRGEGDRESGREGCKVGREGEKSQGGRESCRREKEENNKNALTTLC